MTLVPPTALWDPQRQDKAYITKVTQGIDLSSRKQVTPSPSSMCGGVSLCLENPKALLIPVKELNEIEAEVTTARRLDRKSSLCVVGS